MIRYLIGGTADVGRQQYIGASADAQRSNGFPAFLPSV